MSDVFSSAGPHQRLKTVAWLTAAAAISLWFTMPTAVDPGYWWHLAAGTLTLAHGIPTTEPFSFLPAAHDWVPQQWGFEVLLAKLDSLGAAMAVMAVVATAAIVAAVRAAPRLRAVSPPLSAAAVVVSAVVLSGLTGVRGQVITVLGTAVTIWLIARWREGSTRVVWLLPPLLLVWANLHAGFFVGLAIPLTAAAVTTITRRRPAGEPRARIRPLLIATGVSAAATVINPAGPRLYGYVAETLTTPALTQGIAEWLSPDFHTWLLRIFEAEVMLLIGLWMVGGPPDPLDVVLALGALVAALVAERNVALFAIIAAPQLVTYGTTSLRVHFSGLHVREQHPALMVTACVVIAALAIISVTPRMSAQATLTAEQSGFPAAAVTFVAGHYPGQRIYTREDWGGYLAHRMPGGRVVFVYGETVVLGEDDMRRYDSVTLIESSWRAELAADRISVAIVPHNSQEASALTEAGWHLAFTDDKAGALVLQRS